MSETRKFIDFIIEQKLDLEDYPKLKPLVDEKFNIQMADAHCYFHIIDLVIDWENGRRNFAPLETVVNQYYIIKSKTLLK